MTHTDFIMTLNGFRPIASGIWSRKLSSGTSALIIESRTRFYAIVVSKGYGKHYASVQTFHLLDFDSPNRAVLRGLDDIQVKLTIDLLLGV